jgi:hypothetical protein
MSQREFHIQAPKGWDVSQGFLDLCGPHREGFTGILYEDLFRAENPAQAAEEEWAKEWEPCRLKSEPTTPCYRKCQACWAKLPELSAQIISGRAPRPLTRKV